MNDLAGSAHDAFRRFSRIRSWKFCISLVGLSVLSACTAAPALTEADEVEIYAAVIDRIYTEDDTFGGTFAAPVVYILAKTDDSVGDPGIEQSESRQLSTDTQSEISRALAHLPARVIWTDERSAVPTDASTGAVADNGVIITLGNIRVQDDGTVLVSGSIYIGSLAAGGQTYILEKVDGSWQITGTTGVSWIS